MTVDDLNRYEEDILRAMRAEKPRYHRIVSFLLKLDGLIQEAVRADWRSY